MDLWYILSGQEISESSIMVSQILFLLLVTSAVFMLGFGLYSRRYTTNPATVPYQLLMYFAAGWSLTYALELSSPTLPVKIFLHNVKFIFLPFLSVFELWLVLTFLRRENWVSGWRFGLLCIIPSLATLLALSSPLHSFFRYNFELIQAGEFSVLKYAPGPFLQIYLIYSYILIFLAFFLLVFIRDETHRIYLKQRIMLALALFLPVIIAFSYDVGLRFIPGVNPAPAFFWVMGILYSIALFRYKLFDIIPIARSTVIDGMGMPMIVLNNEEKIVDINPAAASLLDISKSTLGKSLKTCASTWPELVSFASSQFRGRQEIIRKGEEQDFFYEARMDTIYSDSSEAEGKVILLTDITLQKNLEEELRESERRWKSLIDGAPFPIVIIRSSDNIILLVNYRTVEQFQIPAEELIGSPSNRFYGDISIRNMITEQLKTKSHVDDVLMEMKTHDGRMLWVYASVRMITYLGNDAYFVSFADITQRKMLEDTLMQKNADLEMISHSLETTNKKLNLLSSITRHDILNQVQIILFLTDMSYPLSEEEIKQNMAMILEAGKGVQELIEFTAEYQSLGQTKPGWQDISEICADPLIIRMISGISYRIPDVQILIFADPLLKKVFFNLVENSIRHGKTVQSISVSFERKNDEFLLIYEDDGCGVPNEEKEKIFTRGFGMNTGLGLFFIREILDITGLSIRECGIPGEGVRFEINIPEGKYKIDG
jgi:PAS domain S-box-containing protein